jgi:hypothetical protein
MEKKSNLFDMEEAVKFKMLKYSLSLKDVRIIKFEMENKEVLVDLKNNMILLERHFRKGVTPEKDTWTIIDKEKPMPATFYKQIVRIDKPDFPWEKIGENHWVVKFNNDYNIVEISFDEGGHTSWWKINITGVSSTNHGGFRISEFEAVKKLAEGKVRDAVRQINDIIKRSTT